LHGDAGFAVQVRGRSSRTERDPGKSGYPKSSVRRRGLPSSAEAGAAAAAFSPRWRSCHWAALSWPPWWSVPRPRRCRGCLPPAGIGWATRSCLTTV